MGSQIAKSAVIVLLFGASVRAQPGSISGNVVDDTGKQLGGVVVLYNAIGPAGSRGPILASRVVSDGTGAFTIQGLPAGLYHLCGLASVAGQISSCWRGLKPLDVNVSASRQTGGVQVVIGTGAVVNIHVTDSAAHIAGGSRFRLVAMADGGTFQIAKLVTQAGSQFDYTVTIPKDRVSRLMIDSDLAVNDQSGAAVPLRQPGVVLPIVVASGVASSSTSAPSGITLVVR